MSSTIDRPIPTGKAPPLRPDQSELCLGSNQLSNYIATTNLVACPLCGTRLAPETQAETGMPFVPFHWSPLPRTFYPNRRLRIHIIADSFFFVESGVCKQLSRRHPFWRVPLWIAFCFIQTSLFALAGFFGGLAHLPAVLSGRMDDVETVDMGDDTAS